jgi:hypothetical protein
MTYYLGKVSKTEYLILKNQNKITFEFNTTCFQGNKTFFNNNYLNVLNPDNLIYNLETEIEEFVKDKLTGLELKSNIIFNQKQFIQFKLDSCVSIEPETKLKLFIEIDKIKINEKTKSYQIILKLIKFEKIN